MIPPPATSEFPGRSHRCRCPGHRVSPSPRLPSLLASAVVLRGSFWKAAAAAAAAAIAVVTPVSIPRPAPRPGPVPTATSSTVRACVDHSPAGVALGVRWAPFASSSLFPKL